MTQIENPRHSRPIDVHRWSDHPEVKDLVERVWKWAIEGEVSEGGKAPRSLHIPTTI